MPNATGIAKQVRYKVESTYATLPGPAGAQLLRRVESSLDLSKDTYESAELRTDYQVADFRHGTRRTEGSIKGELSPKTYADFIAAALRRDFAAVAPSTGMSITIAAGAVVAGIQQYTVTRAAGSWLTDGVKAGDVGRLTAGSFNVANINKNLFVVSLTATVLTVIPLNGVAMVAEGPIASATFALTGKKTFAPTTGHLDKSFSIEHWHADIAQSEVYQGCKVATVDIGLPATGMATIDLGFMGNGKVTANTSAYFTSPTAATATGIAAAVNGFLMIGGQPVAICTGLSIKLDGGYSGDPVVGSNTMPDIFAGRINVSGNFSAYFDAGTYRDAFWNETEIAIAVALTADNTATSDFVAITLPRVKLGSAKRTDGEKGIMIQCDFKALFNSAGGAGVSSEQTTMTVQDSAA